MLEVYNDLIYFEFSFIVDNLQCDQCLPLYNDKPFKAGDQINAYPCKPCQCYNHSMACTYNASVDLYPSSYNVGGGGVCLNCLHNTAGQQCETCAIGFYRQQGTSLSDVNVCLPCNCFVGSIGSDCAKVSEVLF